MSETTRATDAAKRATDNAAKSSPSNIDTAANTSKDAVNETARATQAATERVKDTAYGMSETATDASNAAADLSNRAAEQGREVLMMGVRTAADVGSRVADISFGRGHHLMSSAANAMDIYRDASERSAERVRALFSSAMMMGRGLQTMQHAWLEMIDHTMETAAHKPQDLLRCKNLVELAEVQRDLYLDAVNHAFEFTTRLLDLAGRTAQDAVRPLQSNHH